MKNHINFIVPHCLYQRFLRIQSNQIKFQWLLKTIRSIFNIIINHTHQFATMWINCTETRIIFQISYPDCPMLFQPLLLITGKDCNRLSCNILFIKIIGIKRFIIFHSTHGTAKFFFQIRTVFIDSIINLRSTCCKYCGQTCIYPDRRLCGNYSLDLMFSKHFHCLIHTVYKYMLCFYIIFFLPVIKLRCLHTVLHHGNRLAI